MKKRTRWVSRFFSSSRALSKTERHDRRAAEMRHLVFGDEVEDRFGAHLPQADVRPRLDADRPGKAPAVAMEHRQRPKIDGMGSHVGGEDIPDGQKICAAMVVDDALGIAGRSRRVVERDSVPFVHGRRALVVLVALGEQVLVFERRNASAGAVVLGIVVVDDERARLGELQGLSHHTREFAVDDQRFRFAVVEHEGDGGRVEAGVERVEHGAAHRHAIVAFEHRWRVGEHHCDRVAAGKASLGERGSEPFRAGVEFAVVAAKGSMRDCDPVRKHLRRALEKGQRRQRLKISRVAVEIAIVRQLGHGHPPSHIQRIIEEAVSGFLL